MKLIYEALCYIGLAAISFIAAGFINTNSPKQASSEIAGTVSAAVDNLADSPAVLAHNSIAVTQPSVSDISGALFGTNIGGSFDLIDHFGEPRQLEDYQGKYLIVFFGYANCLAICSAALPLMADTLNLIETDQDIDIVPLMITVDPDNDTPEYMREKLAEYHPALIGMTGSEGQLADVRRKFQVKTEYVGTDIDNNPIYNHGSFIYLLGPDGKVKTLVPPILEPQKMAEIFVGYIVEAAEKKQNL